MIEMHVAKSIRDDICGHDDNSAGAAYEHEISVEAMKGSDREVAV